MTQPDAPIVIAIDGPAAAGKSTVGRGLADRLGLSYLDTGAMYRAVTFAALQRGVARSSLEAVADMVPTVDIAFEGDRVLVDGVDATDDLRGRAVTREVSKVAANPAVRQHLVAEQRQYVAERGGAVVEGRDIGSVVFPDATLKLFITASPRVRAERRVAQSGGDVDEVEASIITRDKLDSERADSPLTEAVGASLVDTTDLSIDEVVAHIEYLLNQAIKERSGS